MGRIYGDKLDFIICGTQKGGTTALRLHMRTCSPHLCLGEDEQHVLDVLPSLNRGETYQQLAHSARKSCEELNKSNPLKLGVTDPKLLYWAGTQPQRWKALSVHNPTIRIIVLLREPIQRALSQYSMVFNKHTSKSTTFASAVHCYSYASPLPSTYKSRLGSLDYIQRGFYDEQLHSLFSSSIPRRNVLVIISEHIFQNNGNNTLYIYNKILDFIQVPRLSHLNPVFERRNDKKHTFTLATYACLRGVFRPHNTRLYQLLDNTPIVEWECWYAKLDARLRFIFPDEHILFEQDNNNMTSNLSLLQSKKLTAPLFNSTDVENNTMLPATCPFIRRE